MEKLMMFRVDYRVKKKPFTPNNRVAYVVAPNKAHAKEQLMEQYELTNRHQIEMNHIEESSIDKPRIVVTYTV